MLRELDLRHAELSVLLTDDAGIQALNLQHRHKDRPTDVLSFPMTDSGEAQALLGDVVISLPTTERQARGRKRPLVEELRFLLAHGVLHLIGYDHGTPTEKREMVLMTRRLVKAAPLAAAPQQLVARAKPARKANSKSRKRV
jgi:probable rRNA maturation factor